MARYPRPPVSGLPSAKGRPVSLPSTHTQTLALLRDIGAPIFFGMERSTYYWGAKLPLPGWFGGEREGPLPRF